MTRSIDSQQSPLWVRSELVRLDLVRLVTYTNRPSGTIDTVFHFARQSTLFDFDGDGEVEFWPVLEGIGPLTTTINHLGSPNDSELIRKPLEITLSNAPFGSDAARLITTLRDGHTLENATVEWTQLALSDRPTTRRIDLTSLAGDEHIFRYRGRVVRVGPVTNETITLACETDMPMVDWLIADDAATNDPSDYGRRLPVVYGEAKRVRSVAYEVGWVTTLAEDITSGFTGVAKFTDLSGISGSGNLMRIDGEEVLVTYVSDTTGNITARAQSSTSAAAHEVGAPVIEMITTSVYVLAGHAVDAINEIYIRSPIDDSLVRIDSGEFGFTANTSNTSIISGETVATVSFTQAQFRAVIAYLAASGGVSQQPEFDDASANTIKIELPSYALDYTVSGATYSNSFLTTPSSSTPNAKGVLGTTSAQDNGVAFWCPTGGSAGGDRTVKKFRTLVTMSIADGAGNFYARVRANFFGNNVNSSYYKATGSGWEYNAVIASSWSTVSGSPTIDDIERSSAPSSPSDSLEVYMEAGSSATGGLYINKVELEIELDPVSLTRTTDVSVDALAAAMGNGIEIYADIDGAQAPSATMAYKAGAGNLMTAPCDIMRHWIEGRQPPPTAITKSIMLQGYGYNFTSASTSNLVPTADKLFLAALVVECRSDWSDPPTVTGGGLGTWTLVDSVQFYNGTYPDRWETLFVFRVSSASPGSMAPVVFDFGSQTQYQAHWSIVRFNGVDLTTDDGVVQSATGSGVGTSLLATLAAFSDSSNATFGAFGQDGASYQPDLTIGSGFEACHDTGSYLPLLTEFKGTNDTSVDATSDESRGWGAIAIELAAVSSYVATRTVDTDSYDECSTNLGSDVWAFDATTLGFTWEEVLARMAFEARATLVPEETSTATEWKMLTALSTYAFGAASGSVTEWEPGGFVEADQDVRYTHASRFTFPYAPDWSRGDGEEAFTQLVVANEDTNDLTTPNTAAFAAAADAFGSIDAEPMAFKCIQVEATAEEIAGYYAHERIRVPVALYAIKGIPWWEAYALEVGDIISVTPPWASSATKCRVIEYVKEPATEQVELRLVEVE